jgi:hypothetical protein
MRMDTTSDEDSELHPYFFRSRDANGLSAPRLTTIYVAALGQLSDVTLQPSIFCIGCCDACRPRVFQ